MNNQTAIVLNSLSNSDLAFVSINQVGHELNQETDTDCLFLTEEKHPPCIPIPCARMNISEVYSCKGLLISTSLSTANTVAKAIVEAEKVFYVWDLEFLRGKKDFVDNVKIYRNPALTLIARSQSHADAIENYCNRKPDFIIPDLNIGEIKRCLNQVKQNEISQ